MLERRSRNVQFKSVWNLLPMTICRLSEGSVWYEALSILSMTNLCKWTICINFYHCESIQTSRFSNYEIWFMFSSIDGFHRWSTEKKPQAIAVVYTYLIIRFYCPATHNVWAKFKRDHVAGTYFGIRVRIGILYCYMGGSGALNWEIFSFRGPLYWDIKRKSTEWMKVLEKARTVLRKPLSQKMIPVRRRSWGNIWVLPLGQSHLQYRPHLEHRSI